MPVDKVAPPPAVKAPIKRATRSRTVTLDSKAKADPDALASELDRVLKVAQPKATTSASKTTTATATKRVPSTNSTTTTTTATPRTRTVSINRKTTTTTAASTATTSSSATTSTAASAAPTARRTHTARVTSTSSATTLTKRRTKDASPAAAAVPPPPKYPWAVAGQMSSRDRAIAAQAAIRDAGRVLSEAQKSGFKYGDKIDTSPVDEALSSALAGVGVVRELFCPPNGNGLQGLGIEKGAFNLALQCLLLDMHKQALGILVDSKPWVLKLYAHEPLPLELTPTSSKVKKATDYTRLGAFPAPTATIDEGIRMLICNFALAIWCCLLNLDKVEPATVQAYLPFPANDTDPLSPVNLAPTLPAGNNASLAVLICRRITTLGVAPPTPEWLHVRRLTAFLLAVCVSRNQARSNSPDRIWDSLGCTVQVYLQKRTDDEARREVAELIGRMVDIVEQLAKTRNETRGEWFTGSWPEVADMWIGIGRNLGDSKIIDHALTSMTAGVSIGSPARLISSQSTASGSGSGASTPTRAANPSTSTAAALASFSARLAKSLIDADALGKKESVETDKLIENLASADPREVVSLLNELEDSEASLPGASSALRGIERLRRSVVKLLERPAYLSTAREWLEYAFTASEVTITTLKNPSIIQAVARDSLPGLVDTTANVLRVCDVSTGAHSALKFIDRAYATWEACGEHVDVSARVQYGAFLVQSAHSVAYRLTRTNSLSDALAFAQRACDWTLALRAILPAGPEALGSLKSWTVTENALPKRYELVGFCHGSDKAKALEAYVLGLANLPEATLEQIQHTVNSQTLNSIFAALPDAATLFKRISSVATADEPIEGDVCAIVTAALEGRKQSAALRGALVEQIVASIEHAQFRPHVQEAIVGLSDYLLKIYDATYPLRRLRVVVRLMNLVVSTGASQDRFPALIEEATSLVAKEPVNDFQLSGFKFEYQSSALILASLNRYHTEGEPSAAVAALGGEALEVIRAIVLPPIKEANFPAATGKRPVQRRTAPSAPPTRPATAAARTIKSGRTTAAPARRTASSNAEPKAEPAPPAVIVDDMGRFSQLLGSLASLFGLLGHVLPRLDTLRILRAVLRTADGMSDALIHTSGLLAVEYGRLGKFSRAAHVFAQAIKHAAEAKTPISAGTRVDLHLRYARFLASTGSVRHGKEEYLEAEQLAKEIPASGGANYAARYVELCAASERIALAHGALAAIKMAEADVTAAIESLSIAYRLWSRAASGISRIAAAAPEEAETPASPEPETPTSETPTSETPAEAAKAAQLGSRRSSRQQFVLAGKHLGGLQWYYALGVFDSTLDLVAALAQRGTVKECEYYLSQAKGMVPAIRSTALDARVSAQTAALDARKANFESSANNLRHAAEVLAVPDGPDAIELKRLRGELYSRQQAAVEAEEFFATAIEAIVSLDDEFKTTEAHASSPKKEKEPKTPMKEPLLPHALGQILRQRAWILREAGIMDEYQNMMQQLEQVPKAAGEKSEQLFLDARVAMSEAFNHFKTDLFMSSLTESTIAMTMASPDRRGKDRQSTRHSANILLERAVEAFRTTLASEARTGRVEDVRQACVSLAVLGAYQTSLGQGSPAITSMAAGILASMSSLTLDRELLPAINSKVTKPAGDELDWPRLEPEVIAVDADPTTAYWQSVAAKHNAADFLDTKYDLTTLPRTWAVVSITVTDDRNTMLVSRHQNGFDPMVFCIPLDRQGRREGEEESELFTFDAGINEMKAIMEGNDHSIKSIGVCKSMDDRKAWWKERYALDTRLGELLATIEFCWLGAFKTALNPRPIIDHMAFTAFRDRLDVIFQTALSSAGTDTRRGARVKLNDTLLTCFATLGSKCKDEEIEDLVYFVLDQYQFNGIAVALAELDFDQIGVDVKTALGELEVATSMLSSTESNEHLLLALDKNVQGIPWESLPILRGRAVSRIPSLPLLLDQIALGAHLGAPAADKRTVDATKTTFFLNPGGDLTGTEGRFKDRLDALETKGWTGLRGRAPTEQEMQDALRDSELVMYFGHGGAEEYIRGYKVRALPRCAVTMLWGCSSGLLREHGDLDRTGTPYDYVLGGSPCLVANLWDVTDKDIDRVTHLVMDNLGLDADKIGSSSSSKTKSSAGAGKSMSVVQAVSAARSCAKLQFLTGAATVVYGIPVYIK